MKYSEILNRYKCIKESVPSYRLGQHICNTLGVTYTTEEGIDLFCASDDSIAESIFFDMVVKYHWSVNNLYLYTITD
jgi:hypothetical protein